MKKIVGYILVMVCLIITVCVLYSEYNRYKIEETEPVLVKVYEVVDAKSNTIEIIDDYIEPMEVEVKEVEVDPYRYVPVEMVYQTSAKTYMDYRAITDVNSIQYNFIQEEMIICEDGFLRDTEGFIGVAMGSYFGDIGNRFICYLDNGKIIPVIKVEAKNDAHTVYGFCGSTAYEIIEFVIDAQANWMQENVWENGYVFSGNFNNYEDFSGTIVAIEKVVEISS